MTETLGTVIRFHNAHTSIDVTVDEDNSAVRSLIAQLPLKNLDFADNEGYEKLTRLTDPLDTADSPASGIRPGDLICFTPWNSIAFWYDPDGFEPREQLVHMGRYDATMDQLEALTRAPVSAHLATD
ncbi:cyclophilin-like fold protein [Brevibacterium sp. LE-L]|uniref:cyclophilin-like fold protein n=1 Tax=Brevibacterium sp. LE-L TaxID=3418557 RepID=UPI003CF470F0